MYWSARGPHTPFSPDRVHYRSFHWRLTETCGNALWVTIDHHSENSELVQSRLGCSLTTGLVELKSGVQLGSAGVVRIERIQLGLLQVYRHPRQYLPTLHMLSGFPQTESYRSTYCPGRVVCLSFRSSTITELIMHTGTTVGKSWRGPA